MLLETGGGEVASGLPKARNSSHSLLSLTRKAAAIVGDIPRRTHLKIGVTHLLLRPVPEVVAARLRSLAYRLIGFKVGKHATILGNISLDGDGDLYRRLTIGDQCLINTPAYFDLNAPIAIGARVGMGHHSLLITSTHEIGPSYARMGCLGSLPITIEDGVWICAGVTILPGVTIGRGSVVSVGSVVTRDVPPDAMVAGNPARVISYLLPGRRGSGQDICDQDIR